MTVFQNVGANFDLDNSFSLHGHIEESIIMQPRIVGMLIGSALIDSESLPGEYNRCLVRILVLL